MAKIPEVNIASFWNLSNDELPESALSGRIIIVEETKDMYVGTGLTTPILKISDLHVVKTVDELKGKDNILPFLYLVESTNELYFFNKQMLTKCNGLGIIGIYNRYKDLPYSNRIEGLFCVKNDETNNMYTTMYFYDRDTGYTKLHYADFNANSFYQFKINNTYLSARNANNVLNINTDASLYTEVSDGKISISQKEQSKSVLSREQYDLTSGLLEDFPDDKLIWPHMIMVKNEIYVIGYTTGNNLINKIYKYNRIDGWILLNSGSIPYSDRMRYSIVSYNDKIYLFGGSNISNTSTYPDLYEYDPETLTFTKKASMNVARSDFCYGIIDNKLWVIGGRTFDRFTSTFPIRSVEYYDFETDTWTILPTEYDARVNFYAGGSVVLNREIHLLGNGNFVHYTFNVDDLIYTEKNTTPFDAVWSGIINTKYNTIFCICGGVIYRYNKDDTWTNYASLLYNKTNPNICIDDNDVIYSLGHYSANSNAKKLEIVQVFHKDISNDCQITIRQPLDKKMFYDNNISRSLTVPKDGYMEYLCYGGNETLDIIIQDFKY